MYLKYSPASENFQIEKQKATDERIDCLSMFPMKETKSSKILTKGTIYYNL